MSSIFLSHNRQDKTFVRKLAKDLQERELDVWFDEWEIKVGDSIIDKIEEDIQNNDFLIVVLFENSVRSGWVKQEMTLPSFGRSARIKEKCLP